MLDRLTTDGKLLYRREISRHFCIQTPKNGINPISYDVQITIVKTGFIRGGAMLKLQNCDTLLRAILNDTHTCKKSQRIFANTQFGPLKAKGHSVMMVRAKDDVYWFAQILAFFQLRVPGVNAGTEDYASVPNFDNTELFDEVDLALNFVCLPWASEDETDHSTAFSLISADNVEIGDCYGLVPLPSIGSVFHVVLSNYAVMELAQQLPWPANRF